MPPKIKTDDIIDALLDSKVVDALANALSPLIKKIINESLDDKIAALAKAVTEAQQTSAKLSTRVAELMNENADMRLQLTSQEARLDAMETYSRLDNLIIKGLPETSYAERGTRGSADADESLHTADSHSAVESRCWHSARIRYTLTFRLAISRRRIDSGLGGKTRCGQ